MNLDHDSVSVCCLIFTCVRWDECDYVTAEKTCPQRGQRTIYAAYISNSKIF